MKTIPMAVALTLLSSFAFAQDDFKCTIKDGASVKGDGTLTELGPMKLMDQEFVVQGLTGVTVGALENSGVARPEVLDVGTEGYSFKALTVVRTYNNELQHMVGGITYLQIDNYLDGEAVPFYFFDSILVLLTGTCTKY